MADEVDNTSEDWFRIDGQSKTEREFGQWLETNRTEHPVVQQYHGKWKELIDWCDNGNQFSLWDGDNGSMMPVTLNRRKKKIVINLMKPLIETIEGKLNFFYSVVGVPNSSETDDIYGAQVASRLIAQNDYAAGMEDIMEDCKYDLLRPGTTCQKWVWDKDVMATVAPRKKDKGPDTEKAKVSRAGDVVGEVVPIFNIRPDPLANHPRKMRWLIEYREISREDAMDAYGLDDFELQPLQAPKNDKYKGMFVKQADKGKDDNSLLLTQYWEKSNIDYPQGRLLHFLGNKCVYKDENPSPGHKIPYFFLFYKLSSYSFWPHGPLFHVQGIQQEFNRTVSIISEHVEAWKPKMSVGKGALRVANSMTVDNFEIVEVDYSRGEPKPITMPELSGQVMAYRDFLVSSVDRVSNIHEVSYSRLPQYASRAPASLYQMMLEQENDKMNPMLKGINKVLIDIAKFRLELMSQHYDQPRLVRIMGQNKKASVAYYDSVDLNDNLDVRMEMGVSMNQSTTVQTTIITTLFEKGILDQKDKPRILKALSLGTAEQDLRTDMADTEKAIRENQAFIDGTQKQDREHGGVWLYIHDDHPLHMEYHTNLMKSEEVNSWPQDKVDDLDFHINQHFMVIQALLKAQQGAPMPQQSAYDQLQTANRGVATPATAPNNPAASMAPAGPPAQETPMEGGGQPGIMAPQVGGPSI